MKKIFYIAEIGINHNGDLDITKKLIDNAKLAANPEHKPLAAGWIADRVVKVIRHSPSAGKTIAYRLIVEGN